MATLPLAPREVNPFPTCNYHVSCVDFRCNVERNACCESPFDAAYWLAQNDFVWDGVQFVRSGSRPHEKTLIARILRGGLCGPALTTAEQLALILPHFAHEAAA